MKPTLDHPAIQLGLWLQNARQAKGFVKRLFADKIQMSPSKYSEVEAGVIAWLETAHEEAIAATLELADIVVMEFKAMVVDARNAVALKFSQIFSRDQLTPVRSRLSSDRAIGEMERDLILDAVFTPLA